MKEDEYICKCDKVTKSFRDTLALDDVSLNLKRNSIIGLLGSNGAGKSTFLQTIVGLYIPDQGSCSTFGTDASKLSQEQLARIGYVHQQQDLPEWLTVAGMISFVKNYFPTWNNNLEGTLVQNFELPLNKRIKDLSPGMKQRVSILLAVCHEPEFLVLDEPAAALDPLARQDFLSLLLNIIQRENTTIIISSHILSDIEKVVDQVVVLDDGKLKASMDLDEFRHLFLQVEIKSTDSNIPSDLPGNPIEMQVSNGQAKGIIKNKDLELYTKLAEITELIVETKPLTLEDAYRCLVRIEGV